MRPLPARALPLALLLLALAACDDPSGPAGDLSRDEVGGIYDVCTLTFQAAGLRSVDVLATVANPGRPAELRLGVQRDDFDLEYTRRDDVVRALLQGTYERGRSTVTLNFPDEANVASILLPDPLRLDYGNRVLSASPSATFRVPRADYAALAGLTAEETRNLQPQIEGTLTARFAAAGCS